MYGGFQGALNQAPMMPRDASLSGSKYFSDFLFFTLIHRDEDPNEESLVGQRAALHQILVQFRVAESHLGGNVAVQYQRNDGEVGVHRGVAGDNNLYVLSNISIFYLFK